MSAIGMPSHLLAFFAPRPPLEPVPIRGRRARRPYDGVASLVELFEKEPPPKPPPFVSPSENRLKVKEERAKEHREIQNRRRALYDPLVDPDKTKTAEPRRTLFVGRLSYETTEKKLLKTFEPFGQIRDIRVVCDTAAKPRGYAFVEFKSEEGMWNAYKNANHKVVDGRPIVVDTEKARLVSGWLPRRLGGGEGPPRKGVAPVRTRIVYNDPTPSAGRGGGGMMRGRGRGGGYRGGPGVGAGSRGGGGPPPSRYSTSRPSGPPRRSGPYDQSYSRGGGQSRYEPAGRQHTYSTPATGPRSEYRQNDYSSRYYH